MSQQGEQAVVETEENCIECLSCVYICPSGAITITDYHAVKNFYRDVEFSEKVGRFL